MSICPSRRLTVALLLTCWLAGCQKTPPTPRQQAKAALDRGDWAAAAELCSELLPDLPEDRELLRIRAQSYLGLRQTSEAIEDYSLLIRLEPENPDYYYLRQIAYQRAGQPELAEADGNQGRRLDPLYPTAYLYDMRNFIPSSLPDDNESGDEERSSEATGQQAAETTAATDRLAGQAEDGDEWAEEAPTQSGRPADATEASEAAGPADTDGQAVAEDASLDGGLLRKWLSEKRRQGEATPLELPDEPSPLEVPYVPPKLTTALPDSSALPERPADAMIPLPSGPRTTGLPASMRPLPTASTPSTGPRSTGIQSSRPMSIGATGLPVSPTAPTPSGFQPGKFLARPSYPPGTTPPLTTSIPGTAVPTASNDRSKVVSTQLPPERTVPPPVVRNPIVPQPK